MYKVNQSGIDIIISTYKRPGAAIALANQLIKQCRNDDTIIIVSQDDKDQDQAGSNRIKQIFSYPPNLPKARNKGISAGKNPIVLFLDDDIIPSEKLLENHRRCYVNPEIGCVAGYIEDSLFDKNRIIPSSFDPFTGNLIQNFSVKKSQFTISAMGANMSFRRDALQAIGGFDPRFSRNALWEEIDCAFRLLKQNYKIWFCSHARVKHLRSRTGGCRADASWKYIFHSYANTSYFCCKFIPGKFFKSWLSFWKYRLEYDTRIKQDFHHSLLKHDPVKLFAGFTGALLGIIKYMISGKKIGLPDQIFDNQRSGL